MKKIICMLLALLFASGVAYADEDVPELLEPVGVKLDTAVVVRQDIYNLNYYDATISPRVDSLSFVTDGVIDEINVLVGDEVKEGDVLATLDQSDLIDRYGTLTKQLDHQIRSLELDRRKYEVELQIAELELKLMQSDETSDPKQCELKAADIEILRLTHSQSIELKQMAIDDMQAQADVIASRLDNNAIVAPYDGRIVYQASSERGSAVRAYDTFFCIADDDDMYIDSVYISSTVLNSANEIYACIDGVNYDVTPREVDWQQYVSAVLTGAEIRNAFDFAEGVRLPDTVECGMYATIFIKTGEVRDALAIPANALYSDSSGRYVYKVVGDTRVRAAVSVGRTTTIMAQILDGLEEGDVIYVKE